MTAGVLVALKAAEMELPFSSSSALIFESSVLYGFSLSESSSDSLCSEL